MKKVLGILGVLIVVVVLTSVLNPNFVTAYNLANADATRSPSNIVAKDDAKALLIANTRLLARIVQATPSVTPQQKSDLGLTVRDTHGQTRVSTRFWVSHDGLAPRRLPRPASFPPPHS